MTRRWAKRTRRALAALVIGAPLALAGTDASAPGAIDAAARASPAYTIEQRLAIERARQARAHPKWRQLSFAARLDRLAMFARRTAKAMTAKLLQAPAASTPAVADFDGNRTLISSEAGLGVVLQRQPDCSLRYQYGSYAVNLPSLTIQLLGATANYQDQLHARAGLATAAGRFTGGCASPTLGVGSRRGFFLGRTNQGWDMFAAAGYDRLAGTDALYLATLDPATQTLHSFAIDLAQPDVHAIAAGDLDGDGLADVVGLDLAAASITVWLARHDGSVGAARSIALPGRQAEAAVMADFNGDGKVDVVVATVDAANQEIVSVLTGRGDGSFDAAQSFNVGTPRGTVGTQRIANLVAGDFRGLGRQDIVGSNGIVLLNDGSGRFTEGATAFAPRPATSSAGPNLAAADFDRDGKLDVAVSDGATIRIIAGRGDGTFTAGRAYASNDSVGYLSATDLDGDGNVDLYVGLANGGTFGGDQFDVAQAYALMGNGDGSFRGAPSLPFVHTGRNLVDLNGDAVPDAVGVNADVSFTAYLGDGRGGFTARATLPVATITLGSGESFTVREIESFALADVNGDGKADLLFFGKDFVARNSPGEFYSPGLLVALGDGGGGFAAPTFVPAPNFAPPGDFDYGLIASNLLVADVNGDGKGDLVYAYRTTAFFADTLSVGTAVQLGNGDGSFQAPRTIVFHSGPANTAFFLASQVQQVADLNRDGRADLIFATQTATVATFGGFVSKMQVALGAGDGSFATPVDVAGPEQIVRSAGDSLPAPIVVADMDGDGIGDLVALGGTGSASLQVAVVPGRGDGSFKAPILMAYGGQYLGSQQQLAVADFDGDGKLDVVLLDPFSGKSGILLGNGDGSLQSTGSASSPGPSRSILLPVGGAAKAMDLNGDGKPDVIAGSTLLLSVPAAAAPPRDFSVAAADVGASVTAGQSATTTLTLNPSGGFTGTVSFSCSGLPAAAACAFAPQSVTVGAGAAGTTLTVSTTARTAALAGALVFAGMPPVLLMAGLALPRWRRRREGAPALRRWVWAGLVAAAALGLHACGGGGGGGASGAGDPGGGGGPPPPAPAGTPAGTYAVQVTASDGTVSHTVNFTLTVK
ncbi:MAG: VCBS repeat-containing protein [Burkholderiales bacterium]|nr:VCBS repeat-containing protein [Burkholderiales bacterium]